MAGLGHVHTDSIEPDDVANPWPAHENVEGSRPSRARITCARLSTGMDYGSVNDLLRSGHGVAESRTDCPGPKATLTGFDPISASLDVAQILRNFVQ